MRLVLTNNALRNDAEIFYDIGSNFYGGNQNSRNLAKANSVKG